MNELMSRIRALEHRIRQLERAPWPAATPIRATTPDTTVGSLYYVNQTDQEVNTFGIYRLVGSSWALQGTFGNADGLDGGFPYQFVAGGAEIAFAARGSDGLNSFFLSEDYGATWTEKAVPQPSVGFDLVMGRDFEGNYWLKVLAANESDLETYRSTDKGDSWDLINTSASYGGYFAFKQSDPGFVGITGNYASGIKQAALSFNLGASFTDYELSSGTELYGFDGFMVVVNNILIAAWQEIVVGGYEYYGSAFDGSNWAPAVLLLSDLGEVGEVEGGRINLVSDGLTAFLYIDRNIADGVVFTTANGLDWDGFAPPTVDLSNNSEQPLALHKGKRYLAEDNGEHLWVWASSWVEDLSIVPIMHYIFATDQGHGGW